MLHADIRNQLERKKYLSITRHSRWVLLITLKVEKRVNKTFRCQIWFWFSVHEKKSTIPFKNMKYYTSISHWGILIIFCFENWNWSPSTENIQMFKRMYWLSLPLFIKRAGFIFILGSFQGLTYSCCIINDPACSKNK